MSPEEKAVLRKVITYLLIARRSDHITYQALVSGETFKSEVMIPLKALVGWTAEDQLEAEKEVAEFLTDAGGKTLSERTALVQKRIAKKWKVGAVAGIGLAGVVGAAALLLKKPSS